MSDFSVNSPRNTILESLKELSREIEKNDKKQKNVLTRSHIGIWELNIKSGDLVWDEAMCKIYEVKELDVAKGYMDWASMVHPDDLAEVESQLEACKNDIQTNFHSMFRIKHKGQWRTIIAQGFKTYDENDIAKGIIGTNVMIPLSLSKKICKTNEGN